MTRVLYRKQGVVLYVVTLPFTLVAEMGFLTIPVVALVAFTLFGVIAIGTQIENPFGYDSNDLPLSHYCDQLKKEVEWVIYHIPTSTESVLLNGV
jgi:putative membrane protein